jgi:hypothetical protein
MPDIKTDVMAARFEHQKALDELERHKVADRGGGTIANSKPQSAALHPA